MVDINHKIRIKAPLARVYDAIATTKGVAGWWTEETTGDANVGGTLDMRFTSHGAGKGHLGFEVTKREANKAVQWRCTHGPGEWLGTDVTFALAQDGDETTLLFGHRGWREPTELMAHCSLKWATFVLSLRDFVETGTGRPAPNDVSI